MEWPAFFSFFTLFSLLHDGDGVGWKCKGGFRYPFSTGIVLFLLFWFRYYGWMEDRVWVEVRWSGD